MRSVVYVVVIVVVHATVAHRAIADGQRPGNVPRAIDGACGEGPVYAYVSTAVRAVVHIIVMVIIQPIVPDVAVSVRQSPDGPFSIRY
jgi:hypothetical protein